MAGVGLERNAEIMPAALLGARLTQQIAPRREEGGKGAPAEGST